ncbi:hypothetical protein [Bacteroides heparinolyticus]|uniref:hypothetical protein n=1 Tax=Prevotella heparinolytica TaxID=28113 RepID=UPI0035A0D2B0
MGKVKGFMLNRKQYDRIRKMDHCQMTLWAESVYKSGFAVGKKAAEGLTADEVKEVVLNLKGIGEKRAATIVDALVTKMEEKEQKNSGNPVEKI